MTDLAPHEEIRSSAPEESKTGRAEDSADKGEHLSALLDAIAHRGDAPALIAMSREEVKPISAERLAQQARGFARGLQSVGISAGDRVAFVAESSPSLIAALLGAVTSGYVAVPLDVQMEDASLEQSLSDSGAKLLLTTSKRADRLARFGDNQIDEILLLDSAADEGKDGDSSDDNPQGDKFRSWEVLLREEDNVASGAARPAGDAAEQADSDAPAVLFYTSGTTGAPKGVPLSHRNLLTQVHTIAGAKLTKPDDRVLLPLPLHHVYPFVIGLLAPLHLGLPIILPRSLTGPDILQALREGEATFLIGVPRLYRALHDAILSQTENSLGAGGRGALQGMIGTSAWLRKRLRLKLGRAMFRPIHRRMAPKLRVLASGGSPLDPELAWRLEGLGWKVAIGYGLTETSPLLTINPPGAGHLDTVGKPIDAIELRIDKSWRQRLDAEQSSSDSGSAAEESEASGDTEQAEDNHPEDNHPEDNHPEDNHAEAEAGNAEEGEILARGPSVFSGYWNLPEKTKEALSEDGWFRTGDLGYLDKHNRLHVTGRVSTLIITEQGEKVQPDEVEAAYAEAPEIREIGVLQRDQRLVGLVVPETANVEDADDLEQQVRAAVERVNKHLSSFKQVADVVITRQALPRTRIGKIRRRELEQRFKEAEKGESHEAGPLSRDEMSGEDRDLLERPAAGQVWDLLAERFSDQYFSPDSSLRLDLGIDSMQWLNLTMEIMQKAGVELDDEMLAQVDSVRDLLEAVARAARGEDRQDLLENPEHALSERERRRLRPLGPAGQFVATRGFGINRRFVHWYFQLQVEGLERLPEHGPLVIVANHLSRLDPSVLAATLGPERLKQTYWAAWVGATRRNPLTRLGSRLAKTIPIDPQRGVISSLAFGAAVLKRGGILVWFPEGVRSKSGQLQDFRPGIGMLLQRYQVPVIAAHVRGTHEAMPRGRRLPRRHPVHIRFGEILDVRELEQLGQGDTPGERIVDALHHAIERLASEHG